MAAALPALLGAAGGAAGASGGLIPPQSGPDPYQTWESQSIQEQLWRNLIGQQTPVWNGNTGKWVTTAPGNFFSGASKLNLDPKMGKALVPDLIPQYQQALSKLGSWNPNMFQKQQSQAVLQALSGKPSFNLDPAVTDKYFTDTVQSPLLRTWDQQINPRLKESFANVPGFSSRQGTATQQSLSDLQANLVTGRSNLAYQDQALGAQLSESAANRQLQGIGQAQALAMAPLQATGQYMSLLQPFQQNLQSQANASYQQFQRMSPENNPYYSLLFQLGGLNQGIPYGQNTWTPNPGAAVGGALGGFAAGNWLSQNYFNQGGGGGSGGGGGGGPWANYSGSYSGAPNSTGYDPNMSSSQFFG
jgi:hypothetical protein